MGRGETFWHFKDLKKSTGTISLGQLQGRCQRVLQAISNGPHKRHKALMRQYNAGPILITTS